jgi:hypothetical protein
VRLTSRHFDQSSRYILGLRDWITNELTASRAAKAPLISRRHLPKCGTGGAIRDRKSLHRGDDTMVQMFALGFGLAILLNFGVGWLVVLALAVQQPLPS